MKDRDGGIPQLEQVVASLGIDLIPDGWKESWRSSQAVYPAERIFFLQETYYREANGVFGFPDDLSELFLETLARIRASDALSRLVWHTHHALFRDGVEDNWGFCKSWPSFGQSMGELAPMVQGIVAVSGLTKMRRFYADEGISERILVDTASDVRLNMQDYRHKHGQWGLELLGWEVLSLTGRLFRLGRLQFCCRTFRRELEVYRSRKTGEVLVLSGDGVTYRPDGLLDGTNGIDAGSDVWRSTILMESEAVTGNPILPDGRCERQTVQLALEEWQQVLVKDDPILDVHIQEDGPLTAELCRDSYDQALTFFPEYFPDKPFRAFVCESWLLGAPLQQILPHSSNILAFQRSFRLYQAKLTPMGDDFYQYVFYVKPDDLTTAPRDTSLRRAILDHLLAGNLMREGGGFILLDGVG